MKIKKLSIPFVAFLQASGLVLYVTLVSTTMRTFSHLFPNTGDETLPSIIFLLLFVISATISALLVLGRAGVLFWEKRYRESVELISWTVGWGLFYFFLLIFFIYIY